MKKKLLLIADTTLPKTGWGTVAHYSEKELKKYYDVETLIVPLPLLNSPLKFIIAPIQLFFQYLKYRNYFRDKDCVIVVCEPQIPLAGFAKLFGRKFRLLAFGHGTYAYFPYVTFPENLFNRFMMDFVDIFTVPSKYTLSRVKEWRSKKTHVLHWGIDLTRYKRNTNLKQEKIFVTMAGQLKERKGISYLIKSFAKLHKKYPDFKLYLLGKKNPDYETLAKKLGVEKNIVFTGHISGKELLDLYSRAYCHVLPSVNMPDSFEGFGLTHLEANAIGIPSIGTKGTANEDAIKDGYSGYLCKQRDVDDLYRVMDLIVKDKKNYSTLRKQSKIHAKSFSWSATAKHIHDLFEQK